MCSPKVMVDIVGTATRSRMMAGIRGKNTRPEIAVRRLLHGRGFRFRLHEKSLPGKPDIVLPKWKVVIFVNGCFWHQHLGCRFATSPATNAKRWQHKFEQNIARDRRNVSEILALGWRVIVLWECGLRSALGVGESLAWLDESIRSTDGPVFIEWPELGGVARE